MIGIKNRYRENIRKYHNIQLSSYRPFTLVSLFDVAVREITQGYFGSDVPPSESLLFLRKYRNYAGEHVNKVMC